MSIIIIKSKKTMLYDKRAPSLKDKLLAKGEAEKVVEVAKEEVKEKRSKPLKKKK